MSETTLFDVQVIGRLARVTGRTRAGLHPVYFAVPGGGRFLGLGWSHGRGDFDVTIGPYFNGTFRISAGVIESNGFVSEWSNNLEFTIAAVE